MGLTESRISKYLFRGKEETYDIPEEEIYINKDLITFNRYCKLDMKDIEKQKECLDNLERDLHRVLSSREFVETYSPYYEYMGSICKTSYEVSKAGITLGRFNQISNRESPYDGFVSI